MPRGHHSSTKSFNPFTHHSSKKEWSMMSVSEKELYLKEETEYARKLAIQRQKDSKKQITKIIVFSSLALLAIALIIIICIACYQSVAK